MKKNKTFSIILAVCLLGGSGTTATASAPTDDFLSMGYTSGYVAHPSGVVQHQSCLTQNSLLIETDGTALTEEDVQGLPDFKSFRIITWGEDEMIEYVDLSYEKGRTLYLVYFNNQNALRETARKLQLQNDCICNVYITRSESVSPVFAPWYFEIKTIDENTELNVKDFPQFLTLLPNVDGEKNEWFAYMTDELQEISDASYEPNSYDEYLYAESIAEEVLSQHSDVLLEVKPTPSRMQAIFSQELKTQSIWQTAGDCNADGEVNAQDAAEQLLLAAEAGTGAEITVTGANDINADGAVNALDAAAVLVYAAAQGSGQTLSWTEILR